MNYDIAKKATEETEKLQKARRDFEQLKSEEDKFLKDRQEKMQVSLIDINKRISSANTFFDAIIDKITNQLFDYKKRFETFNADLNSTVDYADSMLDAIEVMKQKTEKTEKFIKEKFNELQKFEEKLSVKEKDINKRTIRVEKMMVEADDKLKEAYTLADWARKGKRYTIKK